MAVARRIIRGSAGYICSHGALWHPRVQAAGIGSLLPGLLPARIARAGSYQDPYVTMDCIDFGWSMAARKAGDCGDARPASCHEHEVSPDGLRYGVQGMRASDEVFGEPEDTTECTHSCCLSARRHG